MVPDYEKNHGQVHHFNGRRERVRGHALKLECSSKIGSGAVSGSATDQPKLQDGVEAELETRFGLLAAVEPRATCPERLFGHVVQALSSVSALAIIHFSTITVVNSWAIEFASICLVGIDEKVI